MATTFNIMTHYKRINMIHKRIETLLLTMLMVLLLAFMASPIYAQPGGPPATPIDSGLGLLLAGGVLYGVKKVRNMTKKGPGAHH